MTKYILPIILVGILSGCTILPATYSWDYMGRCWGETKELFMEVDKIWCLQYANPTR